MVRGKTTHKSCVFAVKANYLVICIEGQRLLYAYIECELFRKNKNTSYWKCSGKHLNRSFEKVASLFFPSSFIIKAFTFVSSLGACFAICNGTCNTDVRLGISFVQTTFFPPDLLLVLGPSQ